jgi:glucan phosphoethanolaminetransferase (alkaline phosphatase superfamily)
VYIQGESLRRENLSLNGYARQTTPLLQKDSVISFSDIYSPYTYTVASMAYIFTNADSLHKDRAYTNRSFISFFKKCGFETIWIGNQGQQDGYIYYAHECDSIVLPNINESLYNFQPYTWVDGDMLQPYKSFISKNDKLMLAIVHTIGSHYIYQTHYTKDFAVFKPEPESRIISLNSRQEIINSYDNSILYMDFVVDSMIQLLKNKNAVLIFLSDHGQSLGENGKWVHNHKEEINNHQPACFVWLSDKYKEKNPLAEAALKHNAHQYFNSSFLFPSMLDAAHIQTPLLDTGMSIFRVKN